MKFKEAGKADVRYRQMTIEEIAKLQCEGECNTKMLIRTLNKMLYGIPLDNIVVLEVAGRPEKVVEGVSCVLAIKSLLNNGNAFYDAANGLFCESTGKLCIAARKMLEVFKRDALETAISKICPDDSLKAVVDNLMTCNEMMTNFTNQVCFISCDEKAAEKLMCLFEDV